MTVPVQFSKQLHQVMIPDFQASNDVLDLFCGDAAVTRHLNMHANIRAAGIDIKDTVNLNFQVDLCIG